MNPSTLRRREFQRILLIKPSAVGDVIHTLPVLAKLRRRYPAARIDWVLTPAIAELIGHHPALSNVVFFDRGALARDWRGWLAGLGRMLADLWRTRYDLVIDLHGQFRSAVLTMATHAPVRIGFDRPHNGPRRRRIVSSSPNAYRHGWTGTREGAWLAYTHRIPLPSLGRSRRRSLLVVGANAGTGRGAGRLFTCRSPPRPSLTSRRC